MPGLDRSRTRAELLAANDELPPLMLLEVSGDRPPAMRPGFPSPWGADRRPNIPTRGVPDASRVESKMIMEGLLLSPDQVAESLVVCRSRVYDLMRTRVLPSVKSVPSGPTWINSPTPGICLEHPRQRRGLCLSSPRWALGGCRVCASPGRRRVRRQVYGRTRAEVLLGDHAWK